MFTQPDEIARAHAFMQALDATLEVGHTPPATPDADLLHVAQQLAAADYSAESRSRVQSSHWLKSRSEEEKTMPVRHLPRPVRVGLASAAALVVVMSAFLAIPPLRSWAQDVIEDLFNPMETNIRVFEVEVANSSTLTAEPTLVYPIGSQRFSSVEEAERALGRDIKATSLDLAPYDLAGVNYNMLDREVSIIFTEPNNRLINITVFPSDYAGHDYSLVGSEAIITPVQLNRGDQIIEGAYIEGMWITDAEDVEPTPANSGIVTQSAEWVNNPYLKRLRWYEDGLLYEIIAMGSTGNIPRRDLTLEDMIAIAESMQ